MDMKGNTVLITGGASGIGLALAQRFLNHNTVIVCGRRQEALDDARRRHPALVTRVCDVADPKEREALFQWVKEHHPEVNVLVNNAGVQHRTNLVAADMSWDDHRQEIATNFEAPLHLVTLFLGHLKAKKHAAIVNVTSGLALIPMPIAPVYCATKAAMHSLTLTLRQQLNGTTVEVIEIAPPAVNTDLGGKGLHTAGVPLDEFADSVFEKLNQGREDIGYGPMEPALLASREQFTGFVARLAQRPAQ